MNIIKSIALASSLAFQSAWSPASAANVNGFGLIDTNLPGSLESFNAEYEAPDFLSVAKIIQLNGSQAGGNIPVGHKGLSYTGFARFGRLAATSRIGGPVPASPDLSTTVEISMGFLDQIASENVNPLTVNILRLDVTLGGEMLGFGGANQLTVAQFSMLITDLDSTFVVSQATVGFTRLGESFSVTNTSQDSSPRFVPYPGEEPAFTFDLGSPLFRARGYIDIPLYGVFLGVVLGANVSASSSCGDEVTECLAHTTFSTARIDNARLVDQNGDPIPGATFTSTSGYDYITAPVPEPEAWALMLAAIATLGSLRRSAPQASGGISRLATASVTARLDWSCAGAPGRLRRHRWRLG